MVARRPHGAEGGVANPFAKQLHRPQASTGCEHRCIPRGLGHPGVGIQAASSRSAEPGERIEVGRLVHRLELGTIRPSGLETRERLGVAGQPHTGEDGLEPSGAFGMAGAGVVVEVAGVGREEDRHRHTVASAVVRMVRGARAAAADRATGPARRRTAPRSRARWRAVLVAATTLPMATLAAGPGTDAAGAASTTTTTSTTSTVATGAGATTTTAAAPTTTLRLVAQNPTVASNGTVDAVLALGGVVPPDAELTVYRFKKIDDRATLDAAFAGVLPTLPPEQLDLTAPEGGWSSGQFDLQIATTTSVKREKDKLRVPTEGVYPIRYELHEGDTTLAAVTSFLVRMPDEAVNAPLSVALLLPVHARPALQPDGQVRLTTDDDRSLRVLANAIGHLPADVPFTAVPTPESMSALTGDDRLSVLRQALLASGRQVVSGPFVNLSAAALVNAHMEGELALQVKAGENALADALAPLQPSRQTWFEDGPLDTATLLALEKLGVSQLVVREGALAPIGLPGTVTRPFELAAGNDTFRRVASVDPTLSSRFQITDDPVVGATRLSAELAFIWLDFAHRNETSRGVVLAPPTGWTPNADVLNALVSQLRANPLLKLVSLDGFFTTVPVLSAADGPLGKPRLVASSTISQLPGLQEAIDLRRLRLASDRTMLPTDDDRPLQLDRLLLLASASELDGTARQRYLDEVNAELGKVESLVVPPTSDTVTLFSRKGEIPLRIRRTGTTPLTIKLSIESPKLELPDGNLVSVTITDTEVVQRVRIRVKTSGTFPVTVRYFTADGKRQIGPEAKITIRSAAVSGVGAALSIGAIAFLLIWWIRHVVATRRRHHPPQPPSGPSPDGERPDPPALSALAESFDP